MENSEIKVSIAKSFMYKATSSDAVKGYSKITNPWLRVLDFSTTAERDGRRAKVSKTASPWLDQILQTKYDVLT